MPRCDAIEKCTLPQWTEVIVAFTHFESFGYPAAYQTRCATAPARERVVGRNLLDESTPSTVSRAMTPVII